MLTVYNYTKLTCAYMLFIIIYLIPSLWHVMLQFLLQIQMLLIDRVHRCYTLMPRHGLTMLSDNTPVESSRYICI